MDNKIPKKQVQDRVRDLLNGPETKRFASDIDRRFYEGLDAMPAVHWTADLLAVMARQKSLALAGALAFLAIAVVGYKAFISPELPQVINANGTVKIYRARQNKWFFVKDKEIKLNTGDILKTFDDGTADLVSRNKYHMRLQEGTELILDDIPSKVGNGKIEYTLNKGNVLSYYNKFRSDHREFNIVTDAAVVSAIGTDFAVGILPLQKKTWVGVISGTVRVTGMPGADTPRSAGRVYVKQGEKTMIGEGEAPDRPERLVGDEIMRISDLYGIGKETSVALLITSGNTRVRELLESVSIFVTDKPKGLLSKRMKEIVRDLNSALKERSKERYRENIHKFESLIAENPGFEHESKLLMFIGAYYYHIEDYDRAIGAFKKIIRDYSDSDMASLACCASGIIYEEKLNDDANAMRMYNKVLTDYSHSPEFEESTKGIRRIKGM